LALLLIDPCRVHAYWIVETSGVAAARQRIADPGAPLTLRVYDVTLVDFDGSNANAIDDHRVSSVEGNYYVALDAPGKSIVAEIGVLSREGEFAAVTRSNFLHMPPAAQSAVTEELWAEVPDRDDHWQPRAPEPVEVPPVAGEDDAPSSEPLEPASAVVEVDTTIGLVPDGRAFEELPAEEEVPIAAIVAAEASVVSPAGDAPPEVDIEPEPLQSPEDLARALEERQQQAQEPEADRPVAEAAGAPPEVEQADEAPSDADESRGVIDQTAHAATAAVDAAPDEEPVIVSHSSDMLASWSLARPQPDRRPRLEVQADLIVYGRAAPGTEVVIDGIPIRVSDDGTFEMRFALPATPGAGGGSEPTGGDESS